MKLLCAVLMSAALLPACASQGKVGHYLNNRGADLVDILGLHVMAGKVGAAQVDATQFLTLGITYEDDAWAWGLNKRSVDQWNEDIMAWGVIVGQHNEQRVKGISRVSGTYGWDFSNNWKYMDPDPNNPLDWLTFRGTLALGVGIDLELRVGEAIDFVLGIFTVDLAHDDT